MSLWFQRKADDGKTYRYAIPFAPVVVAVFMCLMITLAISLWRALKVWLDI